MLTVAPRATLFGVMAFTAKLASARLGGAQVAMIRFVVSLIPVFAVPRYRRAALTFTRVDLLFYRGFFGGLAVLCYFLAIEHIAVGVATLLNYTAPIFSGLFAALIIGDPLEFESTANDRTGWSQIAAKVESSVRDLVAQSGAA